VSLALSHLGRLESATNAFGLGEAYSTLADPQGVISRSVSLLHRFPSDCMTSREHKHVDGTTGGVITRHSIATREKRESERLLRVGHF
jgi:hypothetical protein